MQRCFRFEGGTLRVGQLQYSPGDFASLGVVSVGKAAVPMAEGLMDVLVPELRPEQELRGVVVGTAAETRYPQLRAYRGGHPVPDQQSLLAAEAVLAFLEGMRADTLVFFLVSGGASAMLEKPLDGAMTPAETAEFHQTLVHSGLPIEEMNALRKHFSAVKGGRLALAAGEATQCTLLISDVPADALHVVGSGPTMPDPSTIADCRKILLRHRSRHEGALPFSAKVAEFFASEALPETPKGEEEVFSRSGALVLLSSDDLCREACRVAEREGFHVVIDNSCDDWTCERAAEYLLDRMAALRRTYPRVCLVSGGEISVAVKGTGGVGGRNQHFALQCAARIAERGERVTVLSAGTDGVDGNSDAAGAVADETTMERAEALGLDVEEALATFNSHAVLERLGDTVVTGPSGNNVRDLRLLLSGE